MQQTDYNRISLIALGLIVFCTIIAALVATFFLAPMIAFGGGPFGIGGPPNIPDDIIDDLKKEIHDKESVITFKETFTSYRENYNERHALDYIIQARNENTGNVLSLTISYYPIGPPGSTEKFQDRESLVCMPGQGIFGQPDMLNMMRHMGGEDLFIHETIKTTDCLDDDWNPVVISAKS